MSDWKGRYELQSCTLTLIFALFANAVLYGRTDTLGGEDMSLPAQPLPKHLYLDFDRNAERLASQLAGFRRRYGEAFLPGVAEERLLQAFVENFFPERLSSTYFFSNTTVREGFYLTVRPKIDGPRLETLISTGVTVGIHGSLYNAGLTVQGFTELATCDPRPWELEATVLPFTSEQSRNRAVNPLLTLTFLEGLPPISLITRERLEDWRGYLGWKRRLIAANQEGLRYVGARVTDDNQVHFLTVSESAEAFTRYHRRTLRRGELQAYPLEHSSDEWTYRFPIEAKHQIRGTDLGDFREAVAYEGVLPDAEYPWPTPYFAMVTFELSDRVQNRISEADPEQRAELLLDVQSDFPAEGWLAESLHGELSLIRRQQDLVRDLEQQSGNSPFLSAYLFDIKQANVPSGPATIKDWLRPDINEDQRDAVRWMVAAPDIFLMQGPPGTGKTTVIAEAIYQFAKQGKKVLLASQANLAVDNALERLAQTPVIRAVRLSRRGRFSEEGARFSEEKVLGHFYGTLVAEVKKNHLDPLIERREQMRRDGDWLERADFAYADWQRYRQQQAAKRSDVDGLASQLAAEEARQAELQAENEQRRQRQMNLDAFGRALRGEAFETEFLLAEPLLRLFYQEVAGPLTQLREYGIDVNSHWLHPEAGSSAERSLLAREILRRWRTVNALLPTMVADLTRLREGSFVDLQSALAIERCKEELERLEEAMLNDETDDPTLHPRWREAKKRLAELQKQSGTLNRDQYATVFNGRIGDAPAYERLIAPGTPLDSILSTLQVVVPQLEETAQRIALGIHRVLTRVEGIRKEIRITPVDDKEVRRLEADRRLAVRDLEELTNQTRRLEQELITLIESLPKAGLPEKAYSVENYASLRTDLEARIRGEQARLAEQAKVYEVWEPLLRNWVADLSDPEQIENDRHFMIDTYIANCNVIGITCNENRKTLEEVDHTSFDVAIVDEVSKATPPELLMPLMLARKAALVGDHRQLPPLFKEKQGEQEQQSWEEAMQAQQEEATEGEAGEEDRTELTRENYRRYEKMVTASFFKEHFEQAEKQLKSMLFTQYRMHPEIMGVINHFYEHRLVCGLKDPDQERHHGITVLSPDGRPLITPDRHAIWLDSALEPSGHEHWEAQAGTSKINRLEAAMIVETLRKLDERLHQMGWGGERRKAVGVISFYGRQVRLIRNLINKLNKNEWRAIRVEVNTVDQFQGKEKPIILVSLVRNKKGARKTGDSHVAKFERINVAFSRAQELLLIYGARGMFHDYKVKLPNLDRPGHTEKYVYQAIIEELNRNASFWTAGRLFTQGQFQALSEQMPAN